MENEKQKIFKRISETVKNLDKSAEVYLFGSRARGDENSDSDWDILILSENPANIKDEQRFRHILIPLELEIGQAFSVFLYNKNEWNTKHSITPFFRNVTKERIRI